MINEEMKQRLYVEIRKAYYSAQRYNVKATFALLYHEKELLVDQLGKMVRMSDYLLKIDENHYFINFIHTNHAQAFKAAQNLIHALDSHLNDSNSAIAIDTFDTKQPPNLVINRLEQILKEVKKSPYSRIDDENILNEIV